MGVITLSASSIDDAPVVQIDYLFVDYNYRKLVIREINNTVSKYLIIFAMSVAENIKKSIGVKYLALS